jgi:hypothetical protein
VLTLANLPLYSLFTIAHRRIYAISAYWCRLCIWRLGPGGIFFPITVGRRIAMTP